MLLLTSDNSKMLTHFGCKLKHVGLLYQNATPFPWPCGRPTFLQISLTLTFLHMTTLWNYHWCGFCSQMGSNLQTPNIEWAVLFQCGTIVNIIYNQIESFSFLTTKKKCFFPGSRWVQTWKIQIFYETWWFEFWLGQVCQNTVNIIYKLQGVIV